MAYGPFNAGAGKGGGGSAADTSYDNSTSGIEASNVQDALDTVLGATLPRLTVKVAAGSAITITDGTSTITGTANTAGSFTTNLPRTGTWEVTASLNGQTATGSVNATAYQGYTLALSYVSKTLNNNSWATIKKVSDANQGANYWAAGDTKTITINGKVGATTFSNLSIDAFISGFNHNSAKEGTGRIHFLIGKKNGKMVGLTDSSYGNQTSTSGAFTMNTSNTNSGGWASCHMRKTVLGADSSPSNPTANTLLAALPADLRAVMKSVTKYTDNTGNASNTAAAVTATTDYLWLLAEFEIQGARSYANQYEQNSQAQYDYFKAGNSKIAYKYNDVSTAVWSRGRSARYHGNFAFCITHTGGSASSYFATYSGAVLAGFAA